ncbi:MULTISPECIES: helix-turn-helix transcriptional regulator [Actinomycetes]|uniref:helix-turn-helix domain-containing protein n=1 Tax=Actinomycetes TaxID=1760 RepID=UPI0001B556D0|nr:MULTISPECIES: helix-turn-helix transcriptional regulator [Actinomycetes]
MEDNESELARARTEAGLTQEDLARLLRMDVKSVRNWESGRNKPQAKRRHEIAEHLSVSLADLEERIRRTAASRTAPRPKPPGALDGQSQAGQLAAETLALEAAYDEAPSTNLLGRATRHLATVVVARDAACGAEARHELYSIEADAATLMGQLLWDASQRRDSATSQGYFDQAIRAAGQGGNIEAEAHATLRNSYLHLYSFEKDPDAGRALAQRAATLAQPVSPGLCGLALLHVAEANAMRQERRACESALDAAQWQLSQVNDAGVGGEYLSESKIDRMAGSCYVFLGLREPAEQHLVAAADALASKRKSQSIVFGNLALARVRAGEIDGAVDALNKAIDTLEVTRGGGGLNVAFGVGRELRPWRRESSVAAAGERLFALMAGS